MSTFFLIVEIAHTLDVPPVHPFSVGNYVNTFPDTIDKIVSSKVDVVRLCTKSPDTTRYYIKDPRQIYISKREWIKIN